MRALRVVHVRGPLDGTRGERAKPPMKIAVLSTHPIQYQAPLLRALSAQPGVRLTALFGHDHGIRPSFDPQFGRVIQFDSPLLGGYEHRFLRNVSRRPGLSFGGIVNPEVGALLLRGEYDVLVVHGYAFATGLLAVAGPRRRTRVLLRGDSQLRPRRSLAKRVAKQVVLRGIFSRVDHFLTAGTVNAAFYAAYGVPEDRMTLAPYSVDDEYFATRAEAARNDPTAARTALGLPAGIPIFLFSGKLLHNKRPLDLLHAFAAVRAEVPCALVYVGDGAFASALDAEIARLRLGAAVWRLGFRNQSELPRIYGATDVLVLPSDQESWGLVVNEAQACGMATIVSDYVGAAPDLVDPSCVFPVRDVAQLALLMRRLAADPTELTRAKAEASRRIARWGIAETVRGFLDGAEASLRRPPRWSW